MFVTLAASFLQFISYLFSLSELPNSSNTCSSVTSWGSFTTHSIINSIITTTHKLICGTLIWYDCFDLNCAFPAAIFQSDIYPVWSGFLVICRLSTFQVYDAKYYKIEAACDCLLLTRVMGTAVQPQHYVWYSFCFGSMEANSEVLNPFDWGQPSPVCVWMLGKGAYCHTWTSCLVFKAEGPLALWNIPFLWHSSQWQITCYDATTLF